MLYRIKVVYGDRGAGRVVCSDIFYVKANSPEHATGKLFTQKGIDSEKFSKQDKIMSLELEELEAKLIQ